MPPEPFAAVEPRRAGPIVPRNASRFNWCGNNGASVATAAMIEP